MAEFVKIMEIVTNLCEHYGCEKCPCFMNNDCAFDGPFYTDLEGWGRIEKELLEWEEAHKPV